MGGGDDTQPGQSWPSGKCVDRKAEAAKRLEGVTVLDSPAEAFTKEAVITMLADDRAVESVILGSDALSSADKDCVHVMMATILTGHRREIAGGAIAVRASRMCRRRCSVFLPLRRRVN